MMRNFCDKHQTGKNLLHREYGISLILILVLLPALLMIAAFSLDLGFQFARKNDLRNLSQLAAYAASNRLNGKLDGWIDAKLAALEVVKRAKLTSLGDLSDLDTFSGDPDSCVGGVISAFGDQNDPPCSYADNGRVRLTVERGTYWVMQDASVPGTMDFISREGLSTYLELPTPAISNAVRVKITLKSGLTFFSQVFGISEFNQSVQETVATADEVQGKCVAPFAIPACQLFLGTQRSGNYTTDYFQGELQCGRELTFTQANYLDRDIRDGMIRADSYPRPPYYRARVQPDLWLIDKKAIPMRGVIGWYNSDFRAGNPTKISHREASQYISELIEYGGTACLPDRGGGVKLGARFLPLEKLELRDPSSIEIGGTHFKDLLSSWINSGPYSMYDWLSRPGVTNYPFLRGIRPINVPPQIDNAADFPFCPSQLGESHQLIDLNYGPYVSGTGLGVSRMFPMANLFYDRNFPLRSPASDPILPSVRPWTFVNPLCHSGPIGAQDTRDPSRKPYAPVDIMLIAPSIEGTSYCNFSEVMKEAEEGPSFPELKVPSEATRPIVVGMIRANIFDFNFANLGLLTLTDLYRRYGDRNPMNINPSDDPRKECGYHLGSPCGSANPQLYEFPLTSPDPFVYCGPLNSLYPLSGRPLILSDQSQGGNPLCPPQTQYPVQWPGGTTAALSIAYNFPWGEVGTRCFAAPKDGCPGDSSTCQCGAFNSPDCWEYRPRSVQYGCAGIRARLSCDDKFLATADYDRNKMKPSIVPASAS